MSQSSEDRAKLDIATFFDVSLDLLVIRDRDFRIVKANRMWETTLGHAPEELEGQPMLAFIHPEDAEASRGRMHVIEVQDQVLGFVNRYRHRDGGYRHIEWRARRVGELVFGVGRDVTERLAYEAEIAAAKAAAEAANRAKSDFLANMSHEIRTPLNGVIGLAGALARTALTPEQQEIVALIESSGATLERLVSDVLDLSKIEAGQLEIETRAFDLAAELDEVLGLYRMRAEQKGLAFPIVRTDAVRGEFLGDGVRLKQVVGNLLSNAVKFTDEGRVAVRIDVADPAVAGQPSRLMLEVEDTGVGFDEAFARQLFQRFSQADGTITRRFGGTGLGLSITRELIELMGGEIEASSAPGQGSLFRIAVPLTRHHSGSAERPAGRGETPGPPQDPGSVASLRVLLAEDHPVNQRVIELILGPLGVELTTVADGAAAVAAFRAGCFDLVLMDMQMPVMDGLAATRAIREHEARSRLRARTPVIMLSANAMPQHQADAVACGADLHLAKPVTPATLVAGVLEAVGAGPAADDRSLSSAERS